MNVQFVIYLTILSEAKSTYNWITELLMMNWKL
jgi:hypothetical protein